LHKLAVLFNIGIQRKGLTVHLVLNNIWNASDMSRKTRRSKRACLAKDEPIASNLDGTSKNANSGAML